MSSSGLMHDFFHKKRRRSRSPVTIDSTTLHQVPRVDRPHNWKSWTKSRAYYRRCRELALQDPSIGILQRNSQEASTIAPHALPTPPIAEFVDPWTRTLPYWLLMLPLYIHVDTMAHTSYAQLLAYTRALEKERNGLYQDYIKVQDRYRRFVQHVKKRTAQWDRDKSAKENKAAARANATSTSSAGMTTAEVRAPKPKSRRVTASPGRIRPEPMETGRDTPNQPQAQPQTALHPPQAYPVGLPLHDDEANSSLPLISDKIPRPIISHEQNKPSTSQQIHRTKGTLGEVPLIPKRSKHDTTNHEHDNQTVVPPQRQVLGPDGLGCQPNFMTGAVQTFNRQPNEMQESTRVSSNTKQGWISSRFAKEFVANNPLQAPVVGPTNRPIKPEPHPQNGPIPGEGKLNIQPTTRIAIPRPPTTAPYCEVVRKKAERQTLKPHACAECGKFIDAIMEEDKEGVYNRHELMCASRHRHRFTPPDTPPDFWELSFIDERDARRQQEQEQQQQEMALGNNLPTTNATTNMETVTAPGSGVPCKWSSER